uniref:D-alanyl-D-alanine carboxypeptidase (EC) n=1 Tax=uncultured Thiotrichaceae bacterium TaxID=298394 RepID=A0A6S6U098_9GAMM|nr:MAG: D-alanyl-D-alanine carboxypeptidase (EC [uncultured Thiotrichaceae bacterium]
MLVQRTSLIAICSIILAACGTNNTNPSSTNTVPVADPINGYTDVTPRYIVQQKSQSGAQQFALHEQKAAAQRRQWKQENTRKQREAQQRYETEKKRIARDRHNQQYKVEQVRLAQQRLEAEKLRLSRLHYQRKFEADQKRKQAEYTEQQRLAQQKQVQQANLQRQRAAQQRPAQQQYASFAPSPSKIYQGKGRLNRLPSPVRSSLRLRGVSERGMSVYVRPANGRGPAILTAGADTPRNPASTMKLVTTYAALGILGPNYRWPTEIYTSGRISGGTLHGDVIIKGYGNPDLKESDLTQMLQMLSNRGVNNIAGNFVTDTSYFKIPYSRPGAFDGKSAAAYNAQPEALLYQGRGSNYRFKNLAKRVQRSTRNMPRNSGARSDLNNNLFGAFWKVWVGRMGKGMQGRHKRGTTPPNAQLVHRHHSKPLRQIIATINKKSNNVMARQLMLSIGAKGTGVGSPRSGASVIGRFLESRGLRFPELRIENGSGLSRISRISARHLGEMLINAYNSPWRQDYMNSLAVLGVDGTMRNRLKKSGIAGRGRFKTGTLRNVRGLAGYVQASNGQTYVMSVLHNDNKARSKARNAHDELIKWLYYGARGNFASR